MATTLTTTEREYSKYIGGLYFDSRFGRLILVEKVAKRSYTNAFYVTYTVLNHPERRTKDKLAIDFKRDLKNNILKEVENKEHYDNLLADYQGKFKSGILR